MLRVGLTGGIASGKSTVSALLAEQGAVIIDYDVLARDVVEPGTPALAAIAQRFGPGVLDESGALVRPALGAIVFADADARRDLEAITHPAIRQLAAEREAVASAGPGADQAIVVHDNPLLVEMGAHTACDVVVVVDAAPEVQIARMVRDRGMSEADARSRLSAQASRNERTAVADVIVDNGGSLEELHAQVGGLWRELLTWRDRQ